MIIVMIEHSLVDMASLYLADLGRCSEPRNRRAQTYVFQDVLLSGQGNQSFRATTADFLSSLDIEG